MRFALSWMTAGESLICGQEHQQFMPKRLLKLYTDCHAEVLLGPDFSRNLVDLISKLYKRRKERELVIIL